jgi:hypothetical protein
MLRPITWIQGEPRPDQQPRLCLAQLANARIQTELPLGRYHPHGAWLEWVSDDLTNYHTDVSSEQSGEVGAV